ncbi:glycosyltransferase family 4 protein [Microbacterium saperdae]|uniref:Glycosyltransferase involved in cell wall biosynthesis n=1 Tax=Microbacterium saperdae TaxID=69368 RepID=A0A543BQN0_9MICO|nr:glycosyltransferase family 4 protein [Microbacterium saperdae]TQL87135.1 glycosyltransferase involved in cell wall biosynthesis [Microbacterium saperdae]GGM42621.1 glycosyltransferase WbuB [Microbacterium saperdae]
MRIVYLHQYFNTPEQSGSTRSYEFARRLVERGHEVHIVTSLRDADGLARDWSLDVVEGIHVHRLPVEYNNSMGFIQRLRAFGLFAVKSARRARTLRGDLLIATSTPLTIILPAWYASVGRATPIVFEVRDAWPTVPIALGYLKNPIMKTLARWLERFAYRRAAHVIALSEGMKDDACLHGADRDQVTVIPNASDIELFDVDASNGSRWREAHSIPQDSSVVLYSGTFGAANGVGYLVELASIISKSADDVVFVLMGAGAEFEQVAARAEELGLAGDKVRVLPPVPKSEMPSVLSAATVATSVVVPNPAMEANSANKFFDALASGTPIAINHGGWQADLITRHGIGIVLDSFDLEDAAVQLTALLQDPERLLLFSRAAADLARSEFSRDDLATRFIDVAESTARMQRTLTHR